MSSRAAAEFTHIFTLRIFRIFTWLHKSQTLRPRRTLPRSLSFHAPHAIALAQYKYKYKHKYT